MIQLWSSMRDYGAQHGVDPVVFAAVYVARLPFLLASLALLTRRARRRQGVPGATVLFLSLGALPYAYVLAFGRGLPLWLDAAVAALALLVVVQGTRKLRAALRRAADADPTPVAVAPES